MLDSLKAFDPATANSILAAAALSTAPNPGISGEDEFEKAYQEHIGTVLSEIRQKLQLAAMDNSERARVSIDRFLSKALDENVIPGGAAEAALARAGQSGRLSPSIYKVVQPEHFRRVFYSLAVTKDQVHEGINEPDDYQHLMTEDALVGEADVFSIFMKQARAKKGIDANWLLVQSYRRGIEQIAQSAWRIYPKDVDLQHAQEPLDVLRAFVEIFGLNVMVGDTKAKFIDKKTFTKSPVSDELDFLVGAESPPGVHFFHSWSHRKTPNPSIFHVGLAYCINLTQYRASLIAHGASVGSTPVSPPLLRRNEMAYPA